MLARCFAAKSDAARSVTVTSPAMANRCARFSASVRFVIGCALSALVFICASGAVSAEPVIGPRLTVRLYDSFGIPESNLKIAQRTADTIFGRAGVHVAWRLCRASSGLSAIAPDRCVETVRATEVMVRMVPGPPSGESATRVLGYSAVDTEARRGWLSTIFSDRVALVLRTRTGSTSFGECWGARSHTRLVTYCSGPRCMRKTD